MKNDSAQTPASPGEPVVRRLWWCERDLWRQHLLRLNPSARRERFAGVISDTYIERYCAGADPFSTALFGAFVDGELRAAGEFALLDREEPRRAELAFSVEEGWQNQGLGSALFQRVLTHARNQRVYEAFIVAEPGNVRMHRIAEKHGMMLSLNDGELVGRLRLDGPSCGSMVSELVGETVALWRQAPVLRASAC